MYGIEKSWSVEINDANEKEGYIFIVPGEDEEEAERIALELLFSSDIMDIRIGKMKIKRYFDLSCLMCKSKPPKRLG